MSVAPAHALVLHTPSFASRPYSCTRANRLESVCDPIPTGTLFHSFPSLVLSFQVVHKHVCCTQPQVLRPYGHLAGVLPVEKLGLLMQVAPTDDELAAFRAWEGDVAKFYQRVLKASPLYVE